MYRVFFTNFVKMRHCIVHNSITTNHYCMLKNKNKNSIIEICPIRNIVSRFGTKWALLVIVILSEQEAIRFNELCKLIPDISSKVLSETLKTLETDGLVERKIFPVVPPKVEYSLTEISTHLCPSFTN